MNIPVWSAVERKENNMDQKTIDAIVDTLAGLTVVSLLLGGLAVMYPEPAKIVGGIFLATWGIGKLIEWWWN
jgi:uncharacterized membrane protein